MWRIRGQMTSYAAVALADTDTEERISLTRLVHGTSPAAVVMQTASPVLEAAVMVILLVRDGIGEASATVELDRGTNGISHMPLVDNGGIVVRPSAGQSTLMCRRAGTAALGDLCIRIGLRRGTISRPRWRWVPT